MADSHQLRLEVTVSAQLSENWTAWTTVDGIQTFFAPQANIDLAIGGPYEILFFPDQPPGQRGAEGCRVLSFLPDSMLSFSWNAPPDFPAIREMGPATWVVVQLAEIPGGTRVVLTHLGWGQSDDWDGVFAYFEAAWDLVLSRLEHCFSVGPIDWSDPWRPPDPH